MASTLKKLTDKGLIAPPRFLPSNVHYETVMGSVAYGVSSDTSDMDIYGFAIPPKETIFPHLAGKIPGFGKPKPQFEQYQQHQVKAPDELGGRGRIYDLQIYGIVKYFQLAMENNPNIVDSLFTPQNCVLHLTRVGDIVREHRRDFLHKGCWPKFKGYAYSQLHKMKTKQPQGKRQQILAQYGYDVKFAYHVVRLLDECEQILEFGDLDLQRNKEHLKAIRRGDVPEEDIKGWFEIKEKQLEDLYHRSKLPALADEEKLKSLLLHCLEEHYGSLDECVTRQDAATQALREIQSILDRYGPF